MDGHALHDSIGGRMPHRRTLTIVSLFTLLSAAPALAQGGGMRGGGMGGMMGRSDSATLAIMRVVHELVMNHDKLRRTVVNLPNGIRTVTESDDSTMAAMIRSHVVTTGALVTKASDPNLPMSSPALHGILQNGARITRRTEFTPNGVILEETSNDPAIVRQLQTHAAEVTDLVNRGMAAMHEAMMKQRRAAPDTTRYPRPYVDRVAN